MATKKDKDAANDSEIKLTAVQKRKILEHFDGLNERIPDTPELQVVTQTANELGFSTQEVYAAVNQRKTDD